MMRQDVLEIKRGELDALCAALGAEDPEAAERIGAAGARAAACAEEYCVDGAAQAYLDMLEAAPLSLAVHRYVALELIDLERTGDAAEIAAEVAQRRSPDPEGYVLLGELHQTLGHHAVAALAYREAIELGAADEAGARVALADSYLRLSRYDEARASYERALALGPECVHTRLGLAEAYRALGRHEEAVESCRRALELEPDRADVHLALGASLVDAGRAHEAAAALRRCLELICDLNWGQHETLRRAFESLGLHAEAAAAREAWYKPRAGAEGLAESASVVGDVELDEDKIPW